MRLEGQSELNRHNRLLTLDKILAQANEEDKELTKIEMQKLLADNGHFISLPTLYNDLNELARNDTFIQDLASNTYSSIMRKAFTRYERIFNCAMKIHDSDNHLTRNITRETKDGTFNDVIEDNSKAIKLQALTVAKNAEDSIRLMVNGENLHKGASKWLEVSKQQEAELKKLREELRTLKESQKPITAIREDTGTNANNL